MTLFNTNVLYDSILLLLCTCTVKPEYKGHARESEYMTFMSRLPFIYRFKLYALFINSKNERLPFKACFTVLLYRLSYVLLLCGSALSIVYCKFRNYCDVFIIAKNATEVKSQ